MTEAIHTERHGDFILSIVYDKSPMSPRDWDNLTTISAWSRDFSLTDDDAPSLRSAVEDYGPVQVVAEAIFDNRSALVCWPLIVHDYGSSGVKLRLGDRFDAESFDPDDEATGEAWRQASGVVYITLERVQAIGTPPELFEDAAAGEIATYSDYLNGNVYGFMIEEVAKCSLGFEHRTVVESTWGFFPEDKDGKGEWSEAGYGLGYVLEEARACIPNDVLAASLAAAEATKAEQEGTA